MSAALLTGSGCLAAVTPGLWALRIGVIVGALVLWFWTQAWLAKRPATAAGDGGMIADGLHQLTAGWHRRLHENPRRANTLLIASSLVIDLLGLYLLASAIFGASFGPFMGLMLLFALRQVCQAFCPLPPPPGMIWRNPGCPTLLVTYDTSNDLFFSGHTAIAVYGALSLAAALGPLGMMLGGAIILFEMAAVLVLRAHYTLDVFTGAVTALYVHHLAGQLAPVVDGWFGRLVG